MLHSLLQVVKGADIIFLAVKPQFVAPVLKEVRQHLTDKHTIVSIAAGKTLASLKVPFFCPFSQTLRKPLLSDKKGPECSAGPFQSLPYSSVHC